MSKNTTDAAKTEAANKKNARLDHVLGAATDEAKRELGDGDNTEVTATATLDVSKKEGTVTVSDGVRASVNLGTSHSSVDSAAAK